MKTETTKIAVVKPGVLAVDAQTAARMIGVCRAKWFGMNSAGKVPRPLRFGGRCPRWLVSELQAWLVAGAPPREQWESRSAR